MTEDEGPEEPSLVPVREAIEGWAANWRISAPWVYGCACKTLEMWHRGSDVREFFPDAVYYTPATSLYSREWFPEQLTAAFEGFLGYEPTYETASEFKKRFDDVCKAFLGTYIADQEREAASREYPEYPDKRKLELHLEWAVLYQVCEMSPDAIADRYKKGKGDATEVRKQIHSTLKLIGLGRRHAKRGG